MITLNDATLSYPNFKLNCSLSVKPGQIAGLVGENGSGKTTTFKILLGLIEPTGGDVIIDNTKVTNLSPKMRMNIGTVLSDSFFNEVYTVKDISTLLSNFYFNFDKHQFMKTCQNFELPFDKPIKDFSTGMKAKIKVLSALSHNATILFLDEPTSGLDVSARNEIIDMLQDYMDAHPEASILISSHISTDLEKLCDTVYFIKDGSIVMNEDTDIFIDNYGIIKTETESISEDEFILYKKRTTFGWEFLTNQRSFYQENYPNTIIDRANLDDILLMVMKGEKL